MRRKNCKRRASGELTTRPCSGRPPRSQQLASQGGAEAQESSQYAIPLGFRKRTLFKMDFAEVVYISELRTGPAGHFSYRNVAYAMYEAVAKKYPAMAKYLRVHGREGAGGFAEEVERYTTETRGTEKQRIIS